MPRRPEPEPPPPRPEVLAFLRDIKDNPEDDTPRLILADWLEDHDDPRGTFVRLQCQAARLPEDDPGRRKLGQQAAELQEEHWFEWLGPLHQGGVRWAFHRGLLRLAMKASRLAQRGAAGWADTEAWDWVDGLTLERLKPSTIPRLADAPLLDGLLSLRLDQGGQASAAEVLPLVRSGRLANLLTLELTSGYWFGPPFVEALARSGDGSLFPRLTTLVLTNARLGSDQAEALASCPHLGRLTSLSLGGNAIRSAGAQALAASPHLGRLTALDLQWSPIGDEGVAALAASPHLANLTSLDLSSTRCGDAGVTALASSPHMRRLTTLRLNYNDVSTVGLRALAVSPHLTNLTHVEVDWARFTTAEVRPLRQRFG
jgi:uncharacterized protein (TIGR02996 family)